MLYVFDASLRAVSVITHCHSVFFFSFLICVKYNLPAALAEAVILFGIIFLVLLNFC